MRPTRVPRSLPGAEGALGHGARGTCVGRPGGSGRRYDEGAHAPRGGGRRPEGIGSTGLRGPGPNGGVGCHDQGVEDAPGPAPVRRPPALCAVARGRALGGRAGRGGAGNNGHLRRPGHAPAPGGQRLRTGPGRADTRPALGRRLHPGQRARLRVLHPAGQCGPGGAAHSPVVARCLPRKQRLQRRRDGRARLLRRALPGLGVPGLVGRRDGGRHRAGGLRLGRRGHADSRPGTGRTGGAHRAVHGHLRRAVDDPAVDDTALGLDLRHLRQLQRHGHRHLGDRQRGRRPRAHGAAHRRARGQPGLQLRLAGRHNQRRRPALLPVEHRRGAARLHRGLQRPGHQRGGRRRGHAPRRPTRRPRARAASS